MRIVQKSLISGAVLAVLMVAALFSVPLYWASDNPLYNTELAYRCFLRSHRKVVQGRDGWLFYRNSLLSVILPWPRQNALKIETFRDSLRANGIELVVVPVPNKEFVCPEKISSHRPRILSRQRDNLIGHLRSAGVHVVDLLPLFIERAGTGSAPALYDALDTHWMDRAIVLAAGAISDTLRRIDSTVADTMRFNMKDTIEDHCADMILLLNSMKGCDTTYPVHRSSVRTSDGSPAVDDPSSPILIFGDSNVNMGCGEYANAGAHIGRALGMRTRTISRIKAGNSGPFFFEGNKKHLAGKTRFFIWIFASRSLAEPISP
jgi:alginate O-acetyltransferase complex protein AlgJ